MLMSSRLSLEAYIFGFCFGCNVIAGVNPIGYVWYYLRMPSSALENSSSISLSSSLKKSQPRLVTRSCCGFCGLLLLVVLVEADWRRPVLCVGCEGTYFGGAFFVNVFEAAVYLLPSQLLGLMMDGMSSLIKPMRLISLTLCPGMTLISLMSSSTARPERCVSCVRSYPYPRLMSYCAYCCRLCTLSRR
jgi:hypothetical protein